MALNCVRCSILLAFLFSSVVHGSVKKGYGIASKAFKCDDFDALSSVSWWYNWGTNLQNIQEISNCTIDEKYVSSFVPMVWCYNPKWETNVDDRYDVVLGFDEPNSQKRCNLTSKEAADNWHIVEDVADNKKIVSPAAARCNTQCHSSNYTVWFDEFFSYLCENSTRSPCRVDYIATHIYSCKANQTMRWINELYQKYKLKIWLTEFACPYATDPNVELEYMKEVLPLLENSDQVYRYAWFVHRRYTPTTFITTAANLFKSDSSELTALGQFYDSFSSNTPPTDPPTKATDPPTNPTDPPTNPTDPPTNLPRSVKKGYGIATKAFKCDDFDVLSSVSWWYNWGTNLKKIQENCTLDEKYVSSFIPMVWCYNPNWEVNVDDRYDVVLGFNEPNHQKQCNLTSKEAADKWHIVEDAADNKKIVSPAAARCNTLCQSSNYTVWFDEFFSYLCENSTRSPCRVDYIATHIYSCKANQTMRWINELYQKYKLKIWLTEFACPYATDPNVELEYMKEVLPLLENSDQVYRYAWFVHRRYTPTTFITTAANLFKEDSPELTALGKFYDRFPSNIPTDPPTKATDPPTNPTDPPTNPTDPPTNPTDPPTNPTDLPRSMKKGYGIATKAFKCDDFDALSSVSWWYNWGTNLNKIQENCTLDEKYVSSFIPMVWCYNPNWEVNVDDRYDVVLGFNEPNHQKQCNLTSKEAADKWHIVEDVADNKKIVSPAAARCNTLCQSANYTVWFDEFFSYLCKNSSRSPCRVDYIATHIYSCKANQTMRWINELYQKYKLKIWLTEFACPYATDPNVELEYMKEVLPLLENSDQVYRYAWFVHRRYTPTTFITTAANLFKEDSPELTALGKFYDSFPSNIPTNPPTNPTDPPTNPTDPPTNPTDPPTNPTDPPTKATDPPTNPTDPPTNSTDLPRSVKKGYGIATKAFKCDDFDALSSVSWWYNWGTNLKKIQENCTLDEKYVSSFIPMVWCYNPNWEVNIDDRYDVVLGFNEPNHQKQCNLTSKEAADNWHIVEDAADNKKIVSPAAARCNTLCQSANYTVWFDEFFSYLCKNSTRSPCRVDYIATHIYSCKANQTMRWINELYQKYKLKIWLTEFACPYATDPNVELEYMKEVLPLLENSDQVYRYAWFVHRRYTPTTFITTAANLFKEDSPELTALGHFYDSFPSNIPTDPPTKATDPPTNPTDPPTNPTDPPTNPTDPPTNPTDPPTNPTDPPTNPTDPPTNPTDPPTNPTDPPTNPTDPPTNPTDPPTNPTDPPTDPTDPPTNPTDPPTNPTDPPTNPTDPPTNTPTQPTDPPTKPYYAGTCRRRINRK